MRIAQPQPPQLPNTAPADRKKLTVLYFLDGKNNLSPMAKHSFDSLVKVGSDDNVNIVAELGLMKQDVVRGLVGSDGLQDVENLKDANMGTPKTVQEFVEWGMKKYPAEQYMVVLWNHGAGFKGVLTDEEANSMCTNRELAKALEDAQSNAGQKIDLLNFNACLMSQAEVAYEYRNVAKYVVGSQEVEAGLRIPIPGLYGTTPQHKVLEDAKQILKDAGAVTPEQLAKLFVYESKNQMMSGMFTPTQAAIDTSKMPAVRDACEALAGQLLSALEADPKYLDQLRKDIGKAQHYANIDAHLEPYVDYRDLGDFCKVLVKSDAPQAVKDAALAAEKAVGQAVIAEQHAVVSGMGGRSMEGSTGLSVYLPTDYGFDRKGTSPVEGIPVGGTHGYEKTTFAENSTWEKLLKTIAKDDDYAGRFPKLNRKLMNMGQITRFYGYEQVYSACKGALSAGGWSLWPLMGFPYFLPLPGQLTAAAGVVGAGLRVNAGVSKLMEAARRDDSPNRTRLFVDGGLDTVIGLGTGATSLAMAMGAMNPTLRHVAQATAALAVGRIAVNGGAALYRAYQHKDATVAEKLAAAEELKPNLPR